MIDWTNRWPSAGNTSTERALTHRTHTHTHACLQAQQSSNPSLLLGRRNANTAVRVCARFLLHSMGSGKEANDAARRTHNTRNQSTTSRRRTHTRCMHNGEGGKTRPAPNRFCCCCCCCCCLPSTPRSAPTTHPHDANGLHDLSLQEILQARPVLRHRLRARFLLLLLLSAGLGVVGRRRFE